MAFQAIKGVSFFWAGGGETALRARLKDPDVEGGWSSEQPHPH